MTPGLESQTSVLVCAGRAAAHGKILPDKFSDPTAFILLPDAAKKRVEDLHAGITPEGGKARMKQAHLGRLSHMMVARTLTIDDAIREAALSQVVILGAGLDGRAWRMKELKNAIVFEVDHPDTQKDKRVRVAKLKQAAREVRFVGVDFTKDNLSEKLTKAGHNPALPTFWVWEGVVMYLTRKEVAATLSVIAKLSAPKSRLIIVYHRPALILWLVGFVVKKMGEPLRSTFSVEKMGALLEKNGFKVILDEGMPAIGKRLSEGIGQMTRTMHHTRIVTAVR